MAEVVWTEPALSDLDAIADYVALDNPAAAARLVQRFFSPIEQLASLPESGSKLLEFKGWRYRQIIEPPCRAIYRHEKGYVFILHIVRSDRLLKKRALAVRAKPPKGGE
jgi:plasmid stabilization system protein ParE